MNDLRWTEADERGRHLFATLAGYGLPPSDHAVFGSGPLIVRGIIPTGADIDVICRGRAWEAALDLEPMVYDPDHDVSLVSLLEGEITLGIRWGIGEVDIDALIDTAEMIDGLPFVRLEHVVAYKRMAGRPKDLEHLRLLADWRATRL